MTGAPGVPQNFYAQTGNAQNLVSWALSAGATSYTIQRSLDNVTFSTLATLSGSPLATSYLDTAVTQGTQYWYTVYATNTSGNSPTTISQSVIPATTGEMTLSQIRLASMQRADRVNSNFVTLPEYTTFINLALFELYDLLITVYEDYFVTTPVQFTSDGTTFIYNLPDGQTTFTNGINLNQSLVAPPFYKLYGVDLALQNATNAYVTVNKFNFVDRNRFVYPNTSSTIYGVFNLQYRLLGNTPAGVQQIMFIPTPSAGQGVRIWYVPRMTQLLQDTDTTIQGISGWIDYVIMRTAKYVLDKEESDTTKLDQELLFLKGRIEETAANRDQGIPDKISDTRANNGTGYGGQSGFGWNGSIGGF
jgi:hypothetical protein